MTAFSDYLESGLLHHVFRGQDFPKPANVAIALCSGVPRDSDTGVSQYANGGTLPEIPSGNSTGASTGYGRKDLGDPSVLGNSVWTYDSDDHDAGSGLIKNTDTIYLALPPKTGDGYLESPLLILETMELATCLCMQN